MNKFGGLLGGRAGPPEESGTFNVSIVIPVLSGDREFGGRLQRIAAWARKLEWTIELVAVDDCSGLDVEAGASRWRSYFAGFQVAKHEKRRGAGFAARTGLLAARGQYVIVIDPSVTTPIENATSLVECLATGADVAVTSRPRRGETKMDARPFLERAAETTFVALTRLVCPVGVRDTLCGLIGLRRRAARKVAERAQLAGRAFTIEWLAVAEWLGFQTTECPQRWVSRDARPHAMLSAASAPGVLRDLVRTRKRMSVEALCGPATSRELLSETSFTKFDGVRAGMGALRRD